MTDDALAEKRLAAITAFVDIHVPPPDDLPTAYVLFGTNQTAAAASIVVDRYRRGLAPLIIATGGVNRHNGIIEAREFVKFLIAEGVPESVIRYEDRSTDTWQNVEFTLPFLREALVAGLPITAVSKWYHRRTLHVLKTLLPDLGRFYGIGWESVYADSTITRTSWPDVPDGHRRVIREWEEVRHRVDAGELAAVEMVEDAWS